MCVLRGVVCEPAERSEEAMSFSSTLLYSLEIVSFTEPGIY